MPFVQPTCNVNPIKLGLNIKGKNRHCIFSLSPSELAEILIQVALMSNFASKVNPLNLASGATLR